MSIAVRTVLILVGLIHLVPALGVLGAKRLEAMYGVSLADEQVVLLLRHRAALFGLVGMLLCGAGFHEPWRSAALWVGVYSTASFVILAWLGADLAPPLRRVMIVDVGALLLLLAALAAEHLAPVN